MRQPGRLDTGVTGVSSSSFSIIIIIITSRAVLSFYALYAGMLHSRRIQKEYLHGNMGGIVYMYLSTEAYLTNY